MGLLGCYRRTWAQVIVGGDEVARDEVYLRVRSSPSSTLPDGFRRGLGGEEWFAHVPRHDPDLHVFDLRWREHKVGAVSVDGGAGGQPMVELTLDLGGDKLAPELARAGWRCIDRGVGGIRLPLNDPDIHLDETEVRFPGECC